MTDTTLDFVNKDFVEKAVVFEKVERSNIVWRIKYHEKGSTVQDSVDCPLFTPFYLEEGKEYTIIITNRSDILLEVEELSDSEE